MRAWHPGEGQWSSQSVCLTLNITIIIIITVVSGTPHCKREAKEQGGLLAALARPQINGAERGLGVGRATLTCDEQKQEGQGLTGPKEAYSSRAHGCPQASVLVCSTLSYCSELTAEGRRGGRGGSGGCL